ncbi:hypothetical protein CFELI_06510 [Corynebacterium felinum]|uniref:Secreted protein n=1 Tax=Corynebacterium felinum TaxID=131318 RepID=A0ABU2BAA3_9CORY|nr:hypothetical protein [Corynebacterium felinum]WJY94919.1 hypothetical protein CFELI_06510 [Corynebacterium felinum]
MVVFSYTASGCAVAVLIHMVPILCWCCWVVREKNHRFVVCARCERIQRNGGECLMVFVCGGEILAEEGFVGKCCAFDGNELLE